MTASFGRFGLLFYYSLPELFFAVFGAKLFSISFGIIFIFLQHHFADGTFFLKNVEHNLFAFSAKLIMKPGHKPYPNISIDDRLQQAGNKTAKSYRYIAGKLFYID